jgi:hypothetical protein
LGQCTDLGEYEGSVAGSLPTAAEDQRGLIMNFFMINNEMFMKLAYWDSVCTDLGEDQGCVAGSLPATAEDRHGLIMNFFIIYNEMFMKLAYWDSVLTLANTKAVWQVPFLLLQKTNVGWS